MDNDRINKNAAELDQSVGRVGARADWRHASLVANKQGLLRIAIECLYAACESLPEGQEFTSRDWNYLWIDPPFDEEYRGPRIVRIARTEHVELPGPPPPSRFEKARDAAAVVLTLALFLFLLASTLVGCVSLVQRISRW